MRTRVTIGYNDDGTKIQKRLQAQSEDELNDRIIQTYIQSGRISEFLSGDYTVKPKKKTSFKEYAENWKSIYVDGTDMTPRTKQTYNSYLQAHIYPSFGNMYLEDITTEDLQRFIAQFKDHKPKSVKNYYAVLRQIIRAAVDDKIILDDPTRSRRIRLPKDGKHKRRALTLDEMKEILSGMNAMPNSPEKLLLAVLIYTGVRRGEAIGLMWEDIDFEARTITIQRNVTHPHNAPHIGNTKTESGERVIHIGMHFCEILNQMKGKGFLFGGEKPISVHSYDTLMKHIRKSVDLHGARAHEVRHTYLTLLAAKGVDLKTLQTFAGHSNIKTTMDIYVHPNKENLAYAGNMMDDALYNLAPLS